MGVATSLPYDMEEEISFSPQLHWQLFHGKKKVLFLFFILIILIILF